MSIKRYYVQSAAAVCLSVLSALSGTSAIAASCGNTSAGFSSWLSDFKKRAAANGISSRTINSALAGVTYDSRVIHYDRNQHSFKLSFDQFYRRRVDSAMIAKGRRLMKTHASTLNAVEKRFGVPGAVVVAIWGLETAYGAQKGGGFSIVRSLATLAYDCRRSDFFENQLLASLKIIDRGDMSAKALVGGWAGEIGQTQFLPAAYVKYAVDFDGNGHRDLIHSSADVLASTANFLKGHGWQRGQGWGPGTANYNVIREWNKAEVYVKTISVMADKLDGR
ncbi:MAG: lytic transglycosylase domain-containing protein [Hyphomicrobium sp.]